MPIIGLASKILTKNPRNSRSMYKLSGLKCKKGMRIPEKHGLQNVANKCGLVYYKVAPQSERLNDNLGK